MLINIKSTLLVVFFNATTCTNPNGSTTFSESEKNEGFLRSSRLSKPVGQRDRFWVWKKKNLSYLPFLKNVKRCVAFIYCCHFLVKLGIEQKANKSLFHCVWWSQNLARRRPKQKGNFSMKVPKLSIQRSKTMSVSDFRGSDWRSSWIGEFWPLCFTLLAWPITDPN